MSLNNRQKTIESKKFKKDRLYPCKFPLWHILNSKFSITPMSYKGDAERPPPCFVNKWAACTHAVSRETAKCRQHLSHKNSENNDKSSKFEMDPL